MSFHFKRGNVESELEYIWRYEDKTAAELHGIDLYKLKRIFERLSNEAKTKNTTIGARKQKDGTFELFK
jgi:hypothetical protein